MQRSSTIFAGTQSKAGSGRRQGSRPALPRAPVLDWSSFRGDASPLELVGIADAPHSILVTSGRAALYQALQQLCLPAGSTVLVPTYHCPTMIAPVECAGLQHAFFGLQPDGLPDLAGIDEATGNRAKAMIVAHYFGIPRSLATVRAWCDARGIALIEDCAHCLFGQAGERAAGHWGDFATASLSKFFPVPEAGVLASASRSIAPPALKAPCVKAQLKGWVDVFEFSSSHRRLRGLHAVLDPLLRMKNRTSKRRATNADDDVPAAPSMLQSCDMGRIDEAPLHVSKVLRRLLSQERIARRRKENFSALARHFEHASGARPLFSTHPDAIAPYVFPLWVDDAHRVYHALRTAGHPVFRWDRIWPGTPSRPGDVGPLWSEHVLQLLCHQDLSVADVVSTAQALSALLSRGPQLPQPLRHG